MAKHTLELSDDRKTIEWNIPEIAGQTYTTAHFKVRKDMAVFVGRVGLQAIIL